MKKVLVFLVLVVALIAIGEGVSIMSEKVGTTTYVGIARTDRGITPSTNDAVWRITRKIEPTAGNYQFQTGYLTNSAGNIVETMAWTNRAGSAVIYK